jgi:hypothetical protein
MENQPQPPPYDMWGPLERIAKEKEITPQAMMKYIIMSLRGNATVHTMINLKGADSNANAFEAVMGMKQLLANSGLAADVRMPKSVFEIVDIFVLAQLMLDKMNSQRDEIAAKNARVGEALHLVLQEYQNKIESEALNARVIMEERGMFPKEPPKQG